MSKRILSFLLVLVMVVALLPVGILANTYESENQPTRSVQSEDTSALIDEDYPESSVIPMNEGAGDTESAASSVESCSTAPGYISDGTTSFPLPDDSQRPKRAMRLNATAAKAQAENGEYCGDTAAWSFNEKTHELKIFGEGSLYSYTNSSSAPWCTLADEITDLTIGEGITEIGDYAFADLTKLTRISMPTGLAAIGAYAFYADTMIETVTIPDSVKSIGFKAFAKCESLSSINVPLQWNDCPSSDKTSGTVSADYCGHIFEGCKKLTHISVLEGISELPMYAFSNSDYLETVDLPSTLKSITRHAFYNCASLKSVAIPNGVKSIGKSAFCYCSSLSDVTLPDGLEELALYAFNECTSLESILLPDSISAIGYKAFYGCSKLKSVNIPTRWTACPPSDKSSTSDGTVDTSHCGHIFEACKSLKSITIPDGMTSLPSFAFNNCNYIESVDLPKSINEIKNHAFYGCSDLTEITIPYGVSEIQKSTFNSCSSLTNVNLPDTVISIKSYAFDSCKALKAILLPDGIRKIGYKAFADCTALETINIPLSWDECPSGSTSGTVSSSYCGHIFEGCTNLLTIYVPEGITQLPDYAFCYCDSLKKVVFPNSLKNIGKCAFYYSGLEYVNLAPSTEEIGSYAFANCADLKQASINENISEISEYAFSDCTSLAAVSVPSSIKEVRNNTFKNCKNIKNIYYEGTREQWNALETNNNSILGSATVSYGILCDYLEPDFIIDSVYVKPSEEIFDSFYGGLISQSGHKEVNVQEATFGKLSKKMFVSIPKDSFISYGFSTPIIMPQNAMMFIDTTGVVNERADIYLVTTSNDLIYVGTACETSEHLSVDISDITDTVLGIKVVGKDLDGDAPGFDVVSIGLTAKMTDDQSPVALNTTATIMRNERAYNLFTETQKFDADSNEIVSIIINAEWDNNAPGNISIVQNNKVVLTNSSGSFVDIIPGQLFDSNDIYLVLTSADNKIILQKRLGLTVSSGKGTNIHDLSLGENSVTVYKNKNDNSNLLQNFVAANGATVKNSDGEQTTNANGQCTISNDDSGLSVHLDGYTDRDISAKALKVSKNIYLQKASDKPVISGVWIDGKYDVLNENEISLNLIQKQKHELSAEVNWGKDTKGSVTLYQNDKSVDISSPKSFVISDYFDISEDIYVSVTSQEGNVIVKKLALSSSAAVTEKLNSVGVNFGDSLKVTLPDSFPFLGGETLKFGLYSEIPVKWTVENGKIYFAIGMQTDYDDDNGVKSYTESVKKLKNSLKSAKTEAEKYKKLADAEKAFGSIAGTYGGSWGFDCGFSVMGFAEGYYSDDGKTINWLDGGVIMGGNVGVSYSLPFTIVVVPCYVEAGLSAELEAQLNLIMSGEAKSFTPDGILNAELALDIGAGVGIDKAATFGGGVTGKLSPVMTWGNGGISSFNLKGSIEGYLKATVLCLEYKHEFDPWVDKLIYQYPSPKKLMAAKSAAASGDTFMQSIYDASNYTMPDLGYLENGSAFVANKPLLKAAKSNSATANQLSSTNLVTNSYEQAAPKLVRFNDGTKLAAWTGYDSSRSGIDALSLFYSYYDGSSWSEPAQVENDGTMDSDFELKNIGETAYIIWQNASGKISSSATLTEVASKMNISAAAFDKSSKSFTAYEVSQSGNLNMHPTICGNGEKVVAVWVNNSENDIFGKNAVNAIYSSTLSNGAFTKPVLLYGNLNHIDSMAAEFANGVLDVAYSMDTDGDISTSDDLELYVNGSAITDNDTVDSSPSYNAGQLYWYQDGKLQTSSGAQSENLQSDRYKMAIAPDGGKAVLFTVNEGLYSSIYGMFCGADENSFGSPVKLTDGKSRINSFDVQFSGDGELEIIASSQAVTGNENNESSYGNSTIKLYSFNINSALTIENVYYNTEYYCANSIFPIEVTVHNDGMKPCTTETVCVYDGDTLLTEKTFNEKINGGISETLDLELMFNSVEQNKELRIEVVDNSTNQTASETINLVQDDCTIENISWGRNEAGKAIIYADAVNRGYSVHDDITANLREDSIDGKIVDSISIGSLESLKHERVCFEVECDKEQVFYITLDSSADARQCSSAFVVISNEKQEDPSHTHDYTATVIAPTCTERGYTTHTCSCGEGYKDSYVPALGHDYKNGKCSRCGAADPNYKPVVLTDIDGLIPSFKEAIQWAVQNNITAGYEDGTFRPNNTCTRGHVVTFLWRAAGQPEPKSLVNKFSDVSESSPFYKAILWAAEQGITSGYADGTFRPNSACTRAHVVTFLWRYEGKPTASGTVNLNDLGGLNADFTAAIKWAATNGVTSGYADGTFRPNAVCTRAHVVTFLYRDIG